MNLTEQERLIISAVENSAEAPVDEIARKLGMRAHKVRYILGDLKDRGLLTWVVFLNAYPLGFAEFTVRYALLSPEKASTKKLISFLQAHDRVNYIVELGGDSQLYFSITARDAAEAHSLILDISSRFHSLIARKSTA